VKSITEEIKKFTKVVEANGKIMSSSSSVSGGGHSSEEEAKKVDTFADKLDSQLEWFIETSRLFSARYGVDHQLNTRRLRAQLLKSIDRLLPKA
jgi:hypothetical protein